MTYDFWRAKPGNAGDGKRFTLQEINLSPLAHTLYDDGRDPTGPPSFFGLQKKQALSTYNNHIELLAMVEDTHDGTFLAPPPFGSHVRPNAGPLGVGTFTYELSDQSIAVREAANAAMQAIVQRSGLGALHEARRSRARSPRIRSGAAAWPRPPTPASSTTAARRSATRACSASTPRRSRARSA